MHSLLPAPLARVVPETAVGFAAISGTTYAIDLTLLALLFDVARWPYPLAVTTGYVVAFGLAFLLNRWLNFQSHGPLGRQTGRYVVTVLANYVLFILALSTTLEWLGVQYLAARLVAGACEAVFMYVMMRTFVFRLKRYP
ncbi:polysaccharide synthesis protein GtrA [Serinicoccus chungangensis]|uniref:Polysaccharide synthesis protein GtrA n=1 Tax=Serinicoccus chungangensis TaxID=767452 RepID=A0A0W8IEQ1_9MICO|nr:GtrA family protein [Serinicoccus chungangensis]KUG58445.1 polysaccharide synthesis protein GtrA [Serinicoccus chungangensis]